MKKFSVVCLYGFVSIILFAGQDLESIGGMENYTDGYFDQFPAAGGFTQYTNFAGAPAKGLAGLTTLDNRGDGPESMAVTVSDASFNNSCLAIGLEISNGNDSIRREYKTAFGNDSSRIHRIHTRCGEKPGVLPDLSTN